MLLDFSAAMEEYRLIAILRGIPGEMLPDVLDLLYEGGIRLAEITYDATEAVPAAETAARIAMAASRMEGKMYIGAGTVLHTQQLRLTKEAGGTFIISPHTDVQLIAETKALGLVSIPGAMTVSEIVAAHHAGADYIKVFPVSSLGPDFLTQVHGPLPHIPLLAVSGVGLADIPAYLRAGAAGFGIGGAICNRKLCLAGDLDAIRTNAAAYADACRRTPACGEGQNGADTGKPAGTKG